MTARDVFGILIRLLGLCGVIFGLSYSLVGTLMVSGVWNPSTHDYYPNAITYMIAGIFFLLLGLYFLRGAPLLMRFAYGKESSKKS